MSEKRDPPAYQEYAAAMLAKFDFRAMTLAERGLLYTMRLECWVNEYLPSDPVQLARVLGQPAIEVEAALPAVMPFFSVKGESITSPELDNYKLGLAEKRERQSGGGKTGADITNNKRRLAKLVDQDAITSTSTGESSSHLRVPRRGSDESLVQISTNQINPDQINTKQLTVEDLSTQEWIEDFSKTH